MVHVVINGLDGMRAEDRPKKAHEDAICVRIKHGVVWYMCSCRLQSHVKDMNHRNTEYLTANSDTANAKLSLS